MKNKLTIIALAMLFNMNAQISNHRTAGVEDANLGTGSYNTASGDQALYKNTSGNNNTASGFKALYNNETGSYNTASVD